jgi:hypothetical protein
MSQPVTLPPELRYRLLALAGRARLLRAVRGAGVLALFLTVTAGLALAADYFLDLPQLVRQGVFAAWAGLGFALFCQRFLLPVVRRLDAASLAAAVEQAYPDLDERLSTAVELAGKDDLRYGSPALVAQLVAETETASGPLDFRSAVPYRSAVGMATAAGVALALLLAPAIPWAAEYGDLAHRFLLPWSDRPLYDFTVAPGDVTAKRGSSVTVDVSVRPRSPRVHPAALAALVVTDATGNESAQRMRVDRPDEFSFELPVTADCQYRVEARAGTGEPAAASPTYRVTAVTPVELAPGSPTVTVTPPAYTRGTRDEETLSGLVDVTALQGSLVRFEARFTRPAVAARLELASPDGKDYPLALKDNGLAAEVSFAATAGGGYRLVLEAEHGVRTELDGGTLTVKPDLPPTVVRFTGREELKAVTPYEKVGLECQLADDVGVARAAIEYRVNDGPTAREPVTLNGAGRLEASGSYAFTPGLKAKEGDTVRYRLRVEDNLPAELNGPHVVYAPADRWLNLKVVRKAGPVREEEIGVQRETVDRRLEELRQALLREMRGLYKLKLESRVDPALSPEQRDALGSLEGENKANEQALRDLAPEAAANPALAPLAEKARAIADREMQQSEAALRSAGAARLPPAERDGRFKEADDRLGAALEKLDDLKKLNEQIARDRADMLRFEELADKQQKLADRAAELAKKDPAAEKEQAEQLRREQAAVAEELRRLAEQSPSVRKAVEEARAAQARESADRARQLADAQRALAKARADAEGERAKGRLGELADKQRELAEKVARLAEETKAAARAADVRPLRPDDARSAADSLREGDAKLATSRQESSARDLNRLADDLDRAAEQARDPREAARQLARLQDDLRQRAQDESHRQDADRPLADRLAELAREEEAIRKAAEELPVPKEDKDAADNRQTAADQTARAAESLRDQEPRQALGQMEQARRALEELAGKLPPPEDGKRQANAKQPNDEKRQADAKQPEDGQRQADTKQPDDGQRKADAKQPEDGQRQADARQPEDGQRQADAKQPEDGRRQADAQQRDGERPRGLPNKSQGERARQLAREERALRDAVRKAATEKPADNGPHGPDQLGELAKLQEEVARQSGDLAGDIAKRQGEESGAARQGQEASRTTRDAANRMRDGDVPAAKKSGRQAAQRLRELSEGLGQAPPAEGDDPERDLPRRSRELARQQDEINRRLDGLAEDPESRSARQQARQQDLRDQAAKLEKDLNDLSKEMNGSPGEAAKQAADAAHDARQKMDQAAEGDPSQARSSQDQAARSLDRAAGQASRAAAQSGEGRGEPAQASPAAGESVRQARGQMDQAGGQLAQGQASGAKESMENAARALRQAAGELARGPQQPGSGSESSRPGGPGTTGRAPGGRPDPSVFGPGIAKYAGKTWGELPGELRTQIVQDMRAKYGEDYARMIKLYFEQLADTKKGE